MDNQCSETAKKKRLHEMPKEEVSRLSKEEFEIAFKEDRLFTVRDAIAWLSKQNPDAGLMYFEINSNAWCDMSPDMFCTVAEEKLRERDMQTGWHRGDKDIEKKVEEGVKEVFTYVKDDDICIRS